MAGKSFTRAVRVDKVWFDVPGPEEGQQVRYDCIDELPGGVLLDLGAIMGGGSEGQEQARDITKALIEFFEKAIVPEQYAQWIEMTHDQRCGIGMPMMTDIAAYLGQQYSGDRPTGPSSEPTSPRTESGNGSTAGALREVSTYSRSPLPASSR